MPKMKKRSRADFAQLVCDVALEHTANRFRDSPQYLSASNLASALFNLEMANDLPTAIQRLRALKLDSSDYDSICKLFCDFSRVSEEVARYRRGLQSGRLTSEHARSAVRSMYQYLRAYRAQTFKYRNQALALPVPSLQRAPDLSESDTRKWHGQLWSYRDIFDKIATRSELMSETFDEELYHPFMRRHLGDNELQQVSEAMDTINMCLQQTYDAARVYKIFVERKLGPYALRLAELQRGRSQDQPGSLEIDPQGNIVEKEEAKTEPPECLEEQDEDDQAVAALRSESDRTLGAGTSSIRSPASAETESPSDHVKSQAETATKATPSAVSAATRPANGVRSAPLYAGSVTASFSVVEDVVHRRGSHNRAATLGSASNYMTTETGVPQLGSVIRTHGSSVPRVFTGSFNELETGMARLHMESGCGSAAQRPSDQESIIVRDFATPTSTTPGTPVTASIPPIPATLYGRREALLAREAELTQHTTARGQETSGHAQRDGDRSTGAGSAEAGPVRRSSSKRRRENTI